MGVENKVSDRSLYRVLERLGERQPVILERFQQWICHQNFVDPTQVIEFSSSYFEGKSPGVRLWGEYSGQ